MIFIILSNLYNFTVHLHLCRTKLGNSAFSALPSHPASNPKRDSRSAVCRGTRRSATLESYLILDCSIFKVKLFLIFFYNFETSATVVESCLG